MKAEEEKEDMVEDLIEDLVETDLSVEAKTFGNLLPSRTSIIGSATSHGLTPEYTQTVAGGVPQD